MAERHPPYTYTAWYKKASGLTDPASGDIKYLYKGVIPERATFDYSTWTSITEAEFNTGVAASNELGDFEIKRRWEFEHPNYGETPTGTLTGSDVDNAIFLLGDQTTIEADVQTLYTANITTVPPTAAFEIDVTGLWLLSGQWAKEHKAACVSTNPTSALRYLTPSSDEQVRLLLIVLENYEKYDNAGVTVSSLSGSEKTSIESQLAGLKATINIFETS